MDQFVAIAWLSRFFGVTPDTILFFIAVFVVGCNLVAKIIPETSTGFWGQARKIASVLGLYVSSRITAQTSVMDVAKATLREIPKVEKAALKDKIGELIQDDLAPLVERGPGGKFRSIRASREFGFISLQLLTAMFLVLAILGGLIFSLAGCTTLKEEANCANAGKVRIAAAATIRAIDRACPIPSASPAAAPS